MKNIKLNPPRSYTDISFELYLRLLNIQTRPTGLNSLEEQYFNMERSVQLLSILTDKSISDIEALQASEVNQAISKLKFLEAEMPLVKVNHKPKKVQEVSYANFIEYINLTRSKEAIKNLPQIICLFFKDLTEEEVNQMPADYVFSMFELLKKKQMRYWKRSLFKTIMRTIFLIPKEMIGKLKSKAKSIF